MKEHWIFWSVEDVYRIFFPKTSEPKSESPYRAPTDREVLCNKIISTEVITIRCTLRVGHCGRCSPKWDDIGAARTEAVPVPWGKIVFASVMGMSLAAAGLGCLGVSSQDLNALQDAAKLNLAAYKHSDGGAERALERGAYCAVEGVLRRNGAIPPTTLVPDGGPAVAAGIRCDP